MERPRTKQQAPLPAGAAWAVLLTRTAARTAVTIVIALELWALAPALVGMTSTTVMSGSMTPSLDVGDIVVTRPMPSTELHPGRVVLVDDPDHAGRLRLHRLMAMHDGWLVLRGDANAQADSTPVRTAAVHGVAFLRIPFAGYPLMWLRTGRWDLVAASCAGLLALMLIARSGHLLRPKHPHQKGRTLR